MARLDEVLDEQSDDDVEIRGVADERDPDEEGDMGDGDDEEKVKEKERGAASKDDKPAEPTKKRRPRFTEDHLCGERGLQKAYETFPKMCKYRGEGHEAEFLNRLLRCYMEWSHSLFPYMQFEEMVDRLQSMGGKAKVRRKLEELRGIQREAYLKQRYGQDYEKDLEEYRKAKLREEAEEEEEAARRREELYGASRRRNTETRRPDGEPEIEDLGAEVEVTRREKKEEGKELFASDEEDSEGPQRSGGGANGADGSDKEEPADEDQEEEPVKAKRGRGKGKGKARAQKQRKDAKPKGPGRRKKKNVLSDSDRDDDEKEMSSAAGESESDEHEKPKRKKLRTAGPTRRSKAKSKRNRLEDEEDADQSNDEIDSGKGSSPKPGSSADDDDDDNMTSRLAEFLRGLKAQGQHKVLSAKAIANRAIHECDLHDRDPKTVKAAIVAIYMELTHGEESPEKELHGTRSVDKDLSKVVDGKIGSGDEQARGPMRKKPRTRRVKRHAESDDGDDSDLDVEWTDSTGKPTAMEVQEMGAAKMDSEEDNREEEGPDVTLMMDDGEETVPQNPQVGESSGHDAEDVGATQSVAEQAAGRGKEPRQTDLELDETIRMDQEPETVAQEAVDLDESEARTAADAGSILDSVAADESSGAADNESGVPTSMETEDAKEGSAAPVDDEDLMVSQDF